MPAAMPMANEPIGPTKPEAGVIATRPATAPEQMPSTVGLPRMIHSMSIQVKPAVAVAVWVTSIAMPACIPALTAEPALKPNQPTQSSEAPIMVSTTLCGGAGFLALAEHQRRHQPGRAGIDVHHRAAGEIEHLDPGAVIGGVEEAVGSPHPMRDRRIDEDRPQAR